MTIRCRNCSSPYEIEEQDIAFYDRISPIFNNNKYKIPNPTYCPDCRLQRRLAFRNQLYVYMATSARTGQKIFSMYPSESGIPMFENEIWWGDSWSATEYAMDFSFEKPFFSQLHDLTKRVPIYALATVQMENSDYCNNNRGLKNCYLVFNTSYAEDCMYCENVTRSKDCIDCVRCPELELCYDCSACSKCYNLQSSFCCEECHDSYFLHNCRACSHCIACVNLRRKEYCIFNKQYTKDEYFAYLEKLCLNSYAQRQAFKAKVGDFLLQQPNPHSILTRVEEVSGNYLVQCKEVFDSYFIKDGENIRYGFNLDEGTKDCCDYSFFGKNAELVYECSGSGIDISNLQFCYGCWGGCSDLLYCWECHSCDRCFGCVGLRNSSYCVFNKQYSKDDYERLVAQIIEHMQGTNEWGEFLPMTLSPVPYNNSIAARYFPLSKEELSQKGLRWFEQEVEGANKAIDVSELPDPLPEADSSMVVLSEKSGRAFKITKKEMQLYRRLNVPLPRQAYDERMEARARALGGIQLFKRYCEKTGQELLTTISPELPNIIWEKDVYEEEFSS